MIPDYAKGKESAIRILKLNSRQSRINPQDVNGIVLVRIDLLVCVRRLKHFLIEKNDWKGSV